MSQRKRTFRHESLQDQESIHTILKAITQGVSKGKLSLCDEEGEITLCPKGLLNLKVTASQDTDRHRLNLRITWQADDQPKQSKHLKITSK
jgi:amphi-Trp domain-containing protein